MPEKPTTPDPPPTSKYTVPEPNEKPPVVSSSQPPRFAPRQEELFRRVIELLNVKGVPYAVSGAFALREHTGIYRDTKDLDVFLPTEELQRALDVLREAGFSCEIEDEIWLAKVRDEGYFVDLITGMSNGVITVDLSWIERSRPATVLGLPTRVLDAEELIASKLFVSFRERFDGADIVHIIYGKQGRMQWDRLLDLCGEHWGVLLWSLVLFQYVYPAYSNYVPLRVWDELLDHLRHEFQNPDPEAAFRGTLLDENMFAIDVNEWGRRNLLEEYRERRRQGLPRKDPQAAA